jgi:hypothetical protein
MTGQKSLFERVSGGEEGEAEEEKEEGGKPWFFLRGVVIARL